MVNAANCGAARAAGEFLFSRRAALEYHQKAAKGCWILTKETGNSTYPSIPTHGFQAGTIEFPIHHECGKVDSCVRS